MLWVSVKGLEVSVGSPVPLISFQWPSQHVALTETWLEAGADTARQW